jgi:hypothetical protein
VIRKVYQILPDTRAAKEKHLRVIDESGEDYLYPADYFYLTDPSTSGGACPFSSSTLKTKDDPTIEVTAYLRTAPLTRHVKLRIRLNS